MYTHTQTMKSPMLEIQRTRVRPATTYVRSGG